jgi:hypothetical protein
VRQDPGADGRGHGRARAQQRVAQGHPRPAAGQAAADDPARAHSALSISVRSPACWRWLGPGKGAGCGAGGCELAQRGRGCIAERGWPSATGVCKQWRAAAAALLQSHAHSWESWTHQPAGPAAAAGLTAATRAPPDVCIRSLHTPPGQQAHTQSERAARGPGCLCKHCTLKAKTCAVDQVRHCHACGLPSFADGQLISRCHESRTGEAGLLTGACKQRRRGRRPCASAPPGCRSPPYCARTAYAVPPAMPAQARRAPHRSPAAAGLPSRGQRRQPPGSVSKRSACLPTGSAPVIARRLPSQACRQACKALR